MPETDAGIPLLRGRDPFLERVVDRLGRYPSDFTAAAARAMSPAPASAGHRRAAAVLVPLRFMPSISGSADRGAFVFQLVKRSATVPQPGDLGCPGGMIHPLGDRLLRALLRLSPMPPLSGEAVVHLRARGRATAAMATLFLVTALREAWEEIGLVPWQARFLGPLPTYTLALFDRTIFPLCALVEPRAPFRPNREVARLVEIPLASFFHEQNLGCYRIADQGSPDARRRYGSDHPCLFHRSADGQEEVLWGATFHILTTFLQVVMDYRLPDWQNGRLFVRTFQKDYLTGKADP